MIETFANPGPRFGVAKESSWSRVMIDRTTIGSSGMLRSIAKSEEQRAESSKQSPKETEKTLKPSDLSAFRSLFFAFCSLMS